jgi:hypothetical protein
MASYADGHPVVTTYRVEENGCMVAIQSNNNGDPNVYDYALACDGHVIDGNEMHHSNDLRAIKDFRLRASRTHKVNGLGKVRWSIGLREWAWRGQ